MNSSEKLCPKDQSNNLTNPHQDLSYAMAFANHLIHTTIPKPFFVNQTSKFFESKTCSYNTWARLLLKARRELKSTLTP